MVLLGFGSIGQALLPLLLRHLAARASQFTVLKPSTSGLGVAEQYGVAHEQAKLTRENFEVVLSRHLSAGDFLVNLSVGVSSHALLRWCQQAGVHYTDASTEDWAQPLDVSDEPPAARTNYALREAVLALRTDAGTRPTALITMGANPGLVSLLVKRALLNLAGNGPVPADRDGWARLAQRLQIRVIHVSERDSQVAEPRRRLGEFVNTWSVEAFVEEALQPAELGWGSHERHFPPDGARHAEGCRAAIYLQRSGAATRVRGWAPLAGPYQGFLVTHAESVSLADYLTVGSGDKPAYRPTVHYVYHPCDDTVLSLHELAGREWALQDDRRIVRDTITQGRDELGVLLMGPAHGAYWHGSQLAIDQARALCPFNSATSLQVAAPILAGIVWSLRHPGLGILEPDDLPHDELLEMIDPYLGPLAGEFSSWTPLHRRERLFHEDLDHDDPWQFINFRVR
jgi:homospermidine synthase